MPNSQEMNGKESQLRISTRVSRYRRHWFIIGRLLLAAASSEARLAVMLATDALVMALELEGWMTLQQRTRGTNIHDFSAPPPSPEPDQLQTLLPPAA